MVCFSRAYDFKFFKGCVPQILFGPFLNTLPPNEAMVQKLIGDPVKQL